MLSYFFWISSFTCYKRNHFLGKNSLIIRKSSFRNGFVSNIRVDHEIALENVGRSFGDFSSCGDVFLLEGYFFAILYLQSLSLLNWASPLGAGKTCFARGLIRAKVGDPSLLVTSPSYLLDNTYEYFIDSVGNIST